MKSKHIFIYCIIVLMLIFVFNWQTRDIIGQAFYDLFEKPQSVNSINEIDIALASLEEINFADLPQIYLANTKSDQPPFDKMLNSKKYLIVKGREKYKYILNDFRIKDFMPKDTYYKKANYWNKREIYWLIDKELLYKTLELQNHLSAKGLNHNAFTITNGHRHPTYNKKVGGASQSKHIVGQAVDISVKDINKDGKVTKKDKEIVLEILENKVIKSHGGIGKYPHSKTAIHYDVRGYKARWDKQ